MCHQLAGAGGGARASSAYYGAAEGGVPACPREGQGGGGGRSGRAENEAQALLVNSELVVLRLRGPGAGSWTSAGW